MANKQRTLKDTAVVEGIGAFTGAEVRVEIHPAEINHGPSMELVTPEGVVPVAVSVENIIETENRTVLASRENKDHQINFVEHILATLHGMGVDNAVVRVNSIEVPLFDGSALPFIKAIDATGIIEQDAPRKEIIIERPLFIDDNGLLMVLPSEKPRLTYYLDHENDFAGKRLAQVEVTEENYRERIGVARTFIKEGKVGDLLQSGAVKNQDMNQVLVVYKDRVSQPLRIEDEFCFHKMLDILGDLYLTGRMLRGHVIGVRSGHYQNRKMARKIAAEYAE